MEKPKPPRGQIVPDSGGADAAFLGFAIAVMFLVLFGGC